MLCVVNKKKVSVGGGQLFIAACVLTMPWSASGLGEELCMNHPNGPHSERNDPSLRTVCCCLLKCTGCPGAAPGQQPPPFLVASAQRGPLEEQALLGDFPGLLGTLDMDAWFLKVLLLGTVP